MRYIKFQNKKLRVFLGGNDCYFVDREEAFHHLNRITRDQALIKITGSSKIPFVRGGHVTLPIHNREFQAYLEVSANPY